jgi:choline dehydrogenase-like flavoprotein
MKPKKVYGLEGFPEILSTNHNHGSCRAGASPENSVVNSDLECHDVDNLFIADASVVPFQCTANPSMPTAAVCSHAWRRMVVKHFSRA